MLGPEGNSLTARAEEGTAIDVWRAPPSLPRQARQVANNVQAAKEQLGAIAKELWD